MAEESVTAGTEVTVIATDVDRMARDALSGVNVWFIIEIIIYGIATLTLLILSIAVPLIVNATAGEPVAAAGAAAGLVIGLLVVAAFLALFIVALTAIRNRKRYSFIFMMVMLVISMLWVPVGTIVGAILLTRVNNDEVKKYLNYQA